MNDSIPVPAPAAARRTLIIKICNLLCTVDDDAFYEYVEAILGFDDDDLEDFRDRAPELVVNEAIRRLAARMGESESP
jgi:hypothetical protein